MYKIENEMSVFNVLTNFRYYFSKYEASDNLTLYLFNSPTEHIYTQRKLLYK